MTHADGGFWPNCVRRALLHAPLNLRSTRTTSTAASKLQLPSIREPTAAGTIFAFADIRALSLASHLHIACPPFAHRDNREYQLPSHRTRQRNS